ncbi:MAG: hypothetical protein RR704_15860 [Stenotrophomonas sp.]|uniref:hypothetical protein n=1 Tax=Stenotrophomonas sp. TaxID=69392 RepID=UPI002FCA2C71
MTYRKWQITVASTILLASLQAEAQVNDADGLRHLENQRLELDKRTASITDRHAFDAYAKATEGTDIFPLSKLSPAARARFTESLRFNARGLTTFDYSDLVRELGAADIQRVLKPFGFQHLVAVLPDIRVLSEEDHRVLQTLEATRRLRCSVGEHCNETDYPAYKCASHATCEESSVHTCTSNC